MSEENEGLYAAYQHQIEGAGESVNGKLPDSEKIEVVAYPEERDEEPSDEVDGEVQALADEARQKAESPTATEADPLGYVSNARNAPSQSDTFSFWAAAEESGLGIGSLVRHSAPRTDGQGGSLDTFGIVTKTEGITLGLDDFAIHTYEADSRPPIESIQPAPSRRRAVVNYSARVLSSNHGVQRPVLSGPVYGVRADEMVDVHRRRTDEDGVEPLWPGPDFMLLGFYEDSDGGFGVFAEERARVLGPKQGHVILSGLPGAGKTSLYQTMIIALFAQLRNLEGASINETE